MLSGFVLLDAGLERREVRPTELMSRMWRLARAVHPGMTPTALWRAGSLFMRQMMNRRELRAWLGEGNPALKEMLAWRPSIVSAVNRPYLTSAWGASRRLVAIDDHYRQLAGRAHALRLAPDTMLRLATVEARGQAVEVTLDSPTWFVHEGELSLNLFLAGERIYTVVFSLGQDDGKPTAFIGAIQGLGSERALHIYRGLTHALHGLRPRELLLAAFRTLCREVGVQRVLAVSDARRVSASGYFSGGIRVHSSYDAVWKEHLGELRGDGFHALPLEVARRANESIPSRKRSEYRQRYAMLDQLQADLARGLRDRGHG